MNPDEWLGGAPAGDLERLGAAERGAMRGNQHSGRGTNLVPRSNTTYADQGVDGTRVVPPKSDAPTLAEQGITRRRVAEARPRAADGAA